MKLAFYGGKIAGFITLLSIVSKDYDVKYVIPEDDIIKKLAELLNISTIDKDKINECETFELFRSQEVNLLVCCHGRKIIKKPLLNINCINLHPCLYKYKGARPIGRLIEDENKKASVGVHWMSEKVDEGKTILELFKKVNLGSEQEIYNQLYPIYSEAIISSLNIIEKKLK